MLHFRSLENLNRNVVVWVLIIVHHVRSSHSNLILDFGFNVAQIVRVFLSSVALLIGSILDVVVDTAGSRFRDIFSMFLRLMLYQYCLPGLILISL